MLVAAISAGLGAPPAGRSDEEPPVTELGQWMDRMNNAFRKLRRQVDDESQNKSSVELVAIMHESAVKALDLIPAMTEDVPAAEREQFVEDYRAGINKLIQLLTEIETALKANDNGAAIRLMSQLRAVRKEGHEEFQRETHE